MDICGSSSTWAGQEGRVCSPPQAQLPVAMQTQFATSGGEARVPNVCKGWKADFYFQIGTDRTSTAKLFECSDEQSFVAYLGI